MLIKHPLGEPPLRSTNFIAIPMSIIFSQPEKYTAWLYNEFMQLYSILPQNDNNLQILFYSRLGQGIFTPLESMQLQLTNLELNEDIVDFYRMFIKNGYYLRSFGDVYYIKQLKNERHFYHDFMIYGFDDDKKIFNIRAYVSGVVSDVEATYDEIIQSHLRSEYISQVYGEVTTYKLLDINIQTNIDTLKWHLYDYLNSVNTQRRERPEINCFDWGFWGISTYDLLDQYCENINPQDFGISTANAFCFYEHKTHLLNKLQYLSGKGYINFSAQNEIDLLTICDKANMCLNLIVKIQLKYGRVKPEIISLKNHFKELKDSESGFFDAFCGMNRDLFL